MDDRKIMKLGRSTLVVSLPKQWVEANRLKRGDVLSLEIGTTGSLFVHPKTVKKDPREVTLKIEGDEKKESIIRKIVSCYINGCSNVRLVSTEVFTVAQQRAIRNMAGKIYLRIMQANSTEFVLQSLLDTSKIPLDVGIRRMHIIAVSMLRDVLKALKQNDPKLASLVYELDDDVDQFSALLLRMLNNAAMDMTLSNQMGLTLIDCLDLQTIIHRIEYVADSAASIAKSIIGLRHEEQFPQFLLEPLLEAGYEACGLFEEAIKAFFAHDLDAANKIFDLETEIEKLTHELIERTLEEKRAAIVCATCSIRENITRIVSCGRHVAEVTLNRGIGRKQ